MVKYFSIFSSDQPSKDGMRFSISALEDGIWQASVYGIPSNLSHDLHRPVGWAYAKGLYLDAQKVLTIGYFLLADDEADTLKIGEARKAFFTHLVNSEIRPYAERFKEVLKQLYKEAGNWFSSGMVLYGYDNIVLTAFPNLAEIILKDKDGLVNLEYLLSDFEYISQGVFKSKKSELGIICHPYFRKSLSKYNNFHWTFLDELISLHKQKGITIKVKIDLDFLGYTPSFLPNHEFEYWWGPKYDNNIASIPAGLTQYGSDEFEKLYYSIERTEFVWTKENDLYTLEVEEVKNQPAPTLSDTYACRYIHSIFDSTTGRFVHFDGAIRAYSTELMLERIEKKMTEMGRRSKYTKLFRIDGSLPLSIWKSLTTNYLQGNPQIYEYFGLPKPEVQAVIKSKVMTPLEKYIPYSMNEGEGVRLYVSYYNRNDIQPHNRFIASHDTITLENGPTNAIEYFIVELKKALNKIGSDLALPADCIYLVPEDYYCNLPRIFHSDANTEELLRDTLNGLRLLLSGLIRKQRKKVLSLSLAWNMEDKEVRISVIGHVHDLSLWLNAFETIPIV